MFLSALTATTIAELAFNEIIKVGVGEVVKMSVGGIVDLSNRLRTKIQAKFKNNAQAEAALTEVEQQRNLVALEKVIEHLNIEMQQDRAFASEIREMAQQIINYHNQTNTALKQQNNNYGRDQNIINQPQGNLKVGGF